jgi:hypothetical protein
LRRDRIYAPYAINIFSVENLEGRINVGRALRSSETAMYIYDLVHGQLQCPYHYEYSEEWLLVVDGTIVLRDPAGERTLERGDPVCFAPGSSFRRGRKPPGMPFDFRSPDETFVVFAGRIFLYRRGDERPRVRSGAYARARGVPQAQLGWPSDPHVRARRS